MEKTLKNYVLSQITKNLRHWAPGMIPRLQRNSWLSGVEWYIHFHVDFHMDAHSGVTPPPSAGAHSHTHRHPLVPAYIGCQIPPSQWKGILWLSCLRLLTFSEKSNFCPSLDFGLVRLLFFWFIYTLCQGSASGQGLNSPDYFFLFLIPGRLNPSSSPIFYTPVVWCSPF